MKLTKYYFDISDTTEAHRFNETVEKILIYVGSKYSKSGDIVHALDNLEDFDRVTVSNRPVTPVINSMTNKIDPIGEKIWDTECKRFGDRKTQYRKNLFIAVESIHRYSTKQIQRIGGFCKNEDQL